ncbi:MAG: hypothetical protein P8M73_06025 [Luminiphilus sp.]|nr:hypothetical protein [Luminiphilus sp.]
MLLRRQFILTLGLMPVTFGIWYAAGILFSAPAVWLCDFALTGLYPTLIESVRLNGADMVTKLTIGEANGQLIAATEAGNQIALKVNTRVVSYSIAFYAALLIASNLEQSVYKFCIGLFWLWLLMAFGLASILGKDLLLMMGAAFLNATGIASGNLLALTYQFNVLLMPTLAPVCLWAWQLRGSPLWSELSRDIANAAASR